MLSSVKLFTLESNCVNNPSNATKHGRRTCNKSSGTCKAKETTQLFSGEEAWGQSWFCRTKSILIARTPQRELRLPSRLSMWNFFFNWWSCSKSGGVYNPPVESEMCPISHAQCETHTNAPVLCFLLPELYLPQLKLRATPCSRTLRTSDLPSAVSKKSGIRGITMGASKASTGLPLGKHSIEDEFCCLRNGSLPHPLVMHRTTGLVCL